jgi:hypothetical protein
MNTPPFLLVKQFLSQGWNFPNPKRVNNDGLFFSYFVYHLVHRFESLEKIQNYQNPHFNSYAKTN